MNKKNIIIALTAAALATGAGFVTYRHFHPSGSAGEEAKVKYNCPMHPTYISDRPGECPICGMDLVPMEEHDHSGGESMDMGGESGMKERKIKFYRNPMNPAITSQTPAKDEMGMDFIPVYEDEAGKNGAPFRVTPERRQKIGLRTAPARIMAMFADIRAQGRVAHDPELYRTQQEYLSALSAAARAKESSLEGSAERADALLQAGRLRLRLMGMSEDQIDGLAEEGAPDESLLLGSASGGKAWLYAAVYEEDLPLIKQGQVAAATTPSLPGETFAGRIVSIDPVLDPATRSARVRARINDPDGLLRPDMYLGAVIHVPLGRRLAVPDGAVVDTGKTQTVFVDLGDGRLEPRRVTAGARMEGYVEIMDGLEEGERVVTSGNFLIDSESKLKAAAAGFAGE